MKLRNKKTGEIVDLSEGFIRDTYNGEMLQIKPVAISNKEGYVYNSLDELNEEWEDYEEPKDIWWLDNEGCVNHTSGDFNDSFRKNRIIGNYFLSREEAELAVRKLKAWKRLKDKGFRFYKKWDSKEPEGSFYYVEIHGKIDPVPTDVEFMKDLDLLFSGAVRC